MKIYKTEEITEKLNKRNKIKKAISIIVYPIIIVMLFCNIYLMLQKIIKPNETPNLFGYKVFTIISGSMRPTLEIGDMVIIKKTNEENIKKDDIITFKEDDYVVTHKITNIVDDNGEKLYETKGDANNGVDKELKKYEDIEGVYVFKIKKIGNVIMYVQNITVIILIIFVIYLFYLSASKRDDRRIYRHEKRKEYEKNKEDNK